MTRDAIPRKVLFKIQMLAGAMFILMCIREVSSFASDAHVLHFAGIRMIDVHSPFLYEISVHFVYFSNLENLYDQKMDFERGNLVVTRFDEILIL